MRKGRFSPLMNVAAIIRGVKPKGTAKWLEAELGCSPRQSWRILETGRVPGRLRSAVLRLIDEAFAHNKREIARLEDEFRGITYQEMLDRAEARRTSALGPDAPELPGLDIGAEDAAIAPKGDLA